MEHTPGPRKFPLSNVWAPSAAGVAPAWGIRTRGRPGGAPGRGCCVASASGRHDL